MASAAPEPSAGRPSASLHYVVGKIDGKLDQMLLMFQGLREEQDRLGGRVGKMERWQSRIIGGISTLAFLVSAQEIVRVIITRQP